ncbi:MAG: VRR-NUC domain-containing protein, partial [Spirosomaceae bacterium]|nr:VRR-NUC domain-containing protein [Spirosomataceae bacterium]
MQEVPKPDNEKKELPPKYYLDYFEYVLTFVKEKYGTLLKTEEWRFLRKYHCLSEDARCLFIRFSNRRGLFFRTNKLKYPEIEDISKCLSELLEQEFISELSPEKHQSVAPDLLQIFTKPELLKLFKDKELKKLSKGDLVGTIINEFDFDNVTEAVNANFTDVIKVNF